VNKQLWINIGLLGFIILLSVFLIVSENEEIPELPRLSAIDQNDIVQIKILRRDLDNFIFNKQNEIWRMDAPQQLLANPARINAMLRILDVESYSQLNPAEANLDTLGLSNPIVIMKLNNYEFKFGKTDAIDQRRYVLFDGKIHLTSDSLYNQLMANAAFFADMKILPEKIKLKSIQFPENKIELIDNQWQLQSLMDISPDQLNRIAFNWQNAAAISVRKYEAPEKESFITLSMEKGILIKLVVVATEPHLILGRKDLNIQYHMGREETNKLLLIEGVDINEETASPVLELY